MEDPQLLANAALIILENTSKRELNENAISYCLMNFLSPPPSIGRTAKGLCSFKLLKFHDLP